MRRLGGALALMVAACSFDTVGGGGAGLPDPEESSTGSEAGADEGGSSTSGATTSGPGATTQTPPGDDTGVPTPESTTSGTPTDPENGTTEGDVAEDSSTGPDIDCSVPVELSVSAAEGELFAPMALQDYGGTSVASSGSFNAGAIRFSFDVECPSMYRLFGRVRDDDPGVHNCCDPDSFEIEGPGGVDIDWFYGCDTSQAGLSWAPVEVGVFGGDCSEPQPLLVPLTAGTYAFTLRNRESDYLGAVAGIAELVLTNDPNWEP